MGNGDLLLMPSWDEAVLGVKLVTVATDPSKSGLPSIKGIYVLFDRSELKPILAIDGAALTGLRTAAVSGVATRHLARPESSSLLVFGAGAQARWHVEAMREVLPIEEAVVVSRTRSSALELVAEIQGIQARAGAPADASGADVICTCTTSPEPVVSFDAIRPGTHMNAVGAYKPSARELDTATVVNSRLVVETRDAALVEAGDIVIPMQEGALDESQIVADLHELVRGTVVRRSADDVTLFKSVGSAFEDLVVASEVARALS